MMGQSGEREEGDGKGSKGRGHPLVLTYTPYEVLGNNGSRQTWVCTKFGKLIIKKIIEIAATICNILKLKCIKFDFGWGSVPDHAGGVYSAPPGPLAGFKGHTSKEGRM